MLLLRDPLVGQVHHEGAGDEAEGHQDHHGDANVGGCSLTARIIEPTSINTKEIFITSQTGRLPEYLVNILPTLIVKVILKLAPFRMIHTSRKGD